MVKVERAVKEGKKVKAEEDREGKEAGLDRKVMEKIGGCLDQMMIAVVMGALVNKRMR